MRLTLVALAVVVACTPEPRPATRELLTLSGTPYERGFQHGQQLSSKIKSFYTTLLTASLFPYLGREQPDIALFLSEYGKERYRNGHFAYELLLDSARSLERSIPLAARDEMRGIADGSGLSYDEVLVLNTFVDSTLAVRGIALAIRLSRAPTLERLEFVGCNTDGVDNDGDGATDESDEGVFEPFTPSRRATLTEVPARFSLKLRLRDPDGVDPSLVRLSLMGQPVPFTHQAPAFDILEVTAEIQAPASAAQLLMIGAGDRKILVSPPPDHASFMRDTEVLFTTRGAALSATQVLWPILQDGRTRPPSFALALGSAATGAGPVLAHHFALLDANTAHKHTAVFIHQPATGRPFGYVGWAGVAWGFSGMNDRGLGMACNPSDTLDNSVVGSVFEQVADLSQAKLLAKGTPLGFALRRVLETAGDVEAGVATLGTLKYAYGWSCALGDENSGLRAVELDSDIFKEGQGGVYDFGPADGLSSAGPADVVLGSDYAKNQDDISRFMVAGQRVVPQRDWASSFFRSRRAVSWVLGEVKANYGVLTPARVQSLISDSRVVDASDSMNAVVLDLRARQIWSAIGQVPATSGPFEATTVRGAGN